MQDCRTSDRIFFITKSRANCSDSHYDRLWNASMSVILRISDITQTSRDFRDVPIAAVSRCSKQVVAEGAASRQPLPCSPCFLFAQAAIACAFRFLSQPRRPIAPRPVAKSGRAAGSGVAVGTLLTTNSPGFSPYGGPTV